MVARRRACCFQGSTGEHTPPCEEEEEGLTSPVGEARARSRPPPSLGSSRVITRGSARRVSSSRCATMFFLVMIPKRLLQQTT